MNNFSRIKNLNIRSEKYFFYSWGVFQANIHHGRYGHNNTYHNIIHSLSIEHGFSLALCTLNVQRVKIPKVIMHYRFMNKFICKSTWILGFYWCCIASLLGYQGFIDVVSGKKFVCRMSIVSTSGLRHQRNECLSRKNYKKTGISFPLYAETIIGTHHKVIECESKPSIVWIWDLRHQSVFWRHHT